MTFPFVIFLAGALATIGALARLGSPAAGQAEQPPEQRSVWAITLSTPALLVPTLIALVVASIAVESHGWRSGRVSENPFGLWRHDGGEENLVLLVVMSMLVAGYVGLLAAWYRFGKADGGHFWQGIKSHTLTFLLGKLLICAWASFLSNSLQTREPAMALLYLAPSLLLAPLLGTAAQHPGRPLRALRAAFRRSWDMTGTSRLVLFQTLALAAVWIAYWGTTRNHFQSTPGLRSIGDLAQDTSVLSFNPTPLLSLAWGNYREPFVAVLCAGLLMFFSTGFMHAHFRRVLMQPKR